MKGEFIGCAVIQFRASDGRKLSWTEHETREAGDTAVLRYKQFKGVVSVYPHHRRRFCYRVNVYSKGDRP